MLVTGFDDRQGCGYVLRTGSARHRARPGHAARASQRRRRAGHAELAAALRDALVRNPVASLGWNGPTVPLTLEDAAVLAWLRNNLGGVLTVAGGPRPTRAGGARPRGALGDGVPASGRSS